MGWHLASVQRDQVEVCTKSTHGYGGALATLAVNRNARNALQGLCQVSVGEIADILSGDGIDHPLRVPFGVHCPLEARPDSFDHDLFDHGFFCHGVLRADRNGQ